jgi:hypothetical protein
MTQPDYRGARGSNAGDDFHELWALRQALTLLNPRTRLAAVAVEGLRAEDEQGEPTDTWDGVDCTFYFEGNDLSSAKQIVIDQLKYSSANPEKSWTVSRLTSSSNKKGDNSVIARLARVFDSLLRKRPDLLTSGNLKIRLVSNQRINPTVIKALAKKGTPKKRSEREKKDRAALLSASGLTASAFDAFAGALDLSKCGSRSRFATEEKVLLTISSWTEDDARASVDHLMRFVRRMMMPESKGEVITRESILAQLGFSDPGALFPCPSTIRIAPNLVKREEAQTIVNYLLAGNERVCYHGVAGCGKTTLLQDITTRLPQGSVLLIYDCYGSGRYLDSDAYRHRPQDAFLQLSNELAQRLRTPLLVTRSPTADYPRVFKKRLALASEVVSAQSAEALIVVVADAADNSITAAETQSERSFIHDLLLLGDLPSNVRLVITSRTGRLDTLNLPSSFGSPLEIKGFSPGETAEYVRTIWDKAPDSWINDFHYLSDGNPRVQSYSLTFGKGDPDQALEYLRPHGKSLDNVFEEQLKLARNKFGDQLDVKTFCAALVALPRPVPLNVLSVIAKLSSANISDLCADLAPGVRLKDGLISFADEDFEQFIRAEAGTDLSVVYNDIANYLKSIHPTNDYAATHIGSALSNAGRGLEVVDLINAGGEPTAIGDPVLRRQVQLERLKLAMKVCREVGSEADAILTVLVGAAALKTDEAIRNMLIQNPDLTSLFARDTASRLILRDASLIEVHGPLLFHFMAADAVRGDGISVREGYRQMRAWLQRRDQAAKDKQAANPQIDPDRWSIDADDVAAEVEAILRISGPQDAVAQLKRWRPRVLGLNVVLPMALRVVAAGDYKILERCIDEGAIPAPWDLLLLVPLALAQRQIDVSRLRTGLATLLRRGLIRVERLNEIWREENPVGEYLDTIMTACEILAFHGDTSGTLVSVLQRFTEPRIRRADQLHTSQVQLIDLSVRAHALLERLQGRQLTFESYLVDAPPPPDELPTKEKERLKKSAEEKKTELQRFVAPFLELYDVRAQLFVRSTTNLKARNALENAVSHSHHEDYRLQREHSLPGMRTRAALSLAKLIMIPKIDRSFLFERTISTLGSASNPFNSSKVRVLSSLALDLKLHKQILWEVNQIAAKVESAQTSSEAKIEALVRLSRLLVPVSTADAQSLFNRAIKVSDELNEEAVNEIALFEPLARRVANVMPTAQRRSAANNLAAVISDAWIRLDAPEAFPWQKASRALCLLDVNIALAVTARWEDAGIVHRSKLLPDIIDTALADGSLSPGQVAALLPLFDEAEEELLIVIARRAGEVNAANSDLVVEELAWEEVVRFGQGVRGAINDQLMATSGSGTGLWLGKLTEATTFQRQLKSDEDNRVRAKRPRVASNKRGSFVRYNWKKQKYITPEAITSAIRQVRAQTNAPFFPVSTILDRMAIEVQLGDRVAHLEGLRESDSSVISDDELIEALTRRLEDWRDSPSIDDWAHHHSLRILVEKLPTFAQWLTYYKKRIHQFLDQSGASDHEISRALLEGIERHVDSLDARTAYGLVAFIGNYCGSEDAAQVIERYAERLFLRIPAHDNDKLDLDDIPAVGTHGLARYIYALMSDIDVRIRWRAAHVIRSLARVKELDTISAVVALYDRTTESSYRRRDAPFYWLASRLWLFIALDRVANETHTAISHLTGTLLAIASDASFPHTLLRSFAKTAVDKLVSSGTVKLSLSESNTLKGINVSPVPSAKAVSPRDAKFNKYQYTGRKDRRFTFNTSDTLPHWYSDAIGAFADLGKEEFLDQAEHWIVDKWGVTSDPWRWNDEPRQDRLSGQTLNSHRRDGSLPTGERFHTHLEWHAMWCTVGELMQTRALADLDDDDYDSLSRQLTKNGLTEPPNWLADLNLPKPLARRFWVAPSEEVDKWIENITDTDFLSELHPEDDRSIVVSAYLDNRSSSSRNTAHVHSALVSPTTAIALVRALQTVPHYSDYRLPSMEGDFEVDDPPYKLKSWIADGDYNSGIDERDPLRFDLAPIQSLPSDHVFSELDLQFAVEDQPRWRNSINREVVFAYRAWSDVRWSDGGDRILFREDIHSSGYQLIMDKKSLSEYLNKANMDLIIEIQITRRNRGDESRYDQENAKELEFDRVILLRRDGSIEAAEGRLGTWTPSRSRARS